MKTKLSTGASWYLVAAAALGATCRSFETEPPEISNTGGTSAAEGGRGGAGGAAGDEGGNANGGDGGNAGDGGISGHAGDTSGGRSGSEGTSGRGGASGGGTTSAGGTSGESGAGAGPTDTPEPGILGAVRLLVDGVPKCGGSLLTNDWVLTADQCVAFGIEPSSLVVGYGMDVSNFQQVRSVREILRFTGNDGSDESRGHDLLLLGVESPFEIDGRTSGYHRPVWAVTPELVLFPQRCVGWDLRVSEASPTSRLREAMLKPFTFDIQTDNDGRPSGSRMWWLNESADAEQGVLLMQADVGSACFHTVGESTYQHTVHSGNPEVRRDNRPNDGREAYSVALGEREARRWLDSALFESVIEEFQLAGDPGVCSFDAERIDLFGRLSNGAIGWFTWDGAWTEHTALSPPNGVTFLPDSPGAYCTNAGSIELFVTGVDGEIYWRRMAPSEQWNAEWQTVPAVHSPVGTGVSVTGRLADHFYVFAGAASGELRYAEYDGNWKDIWVDMGGLIAGTPAAMMNQENRVDVYTRALSNNEIWMRWMHNGSWLPDWYRTQGPVLSNPTVVSWSNSHLDIMTRSTSNTLGRSLVQVYNAETIVTDVPMPPGNPAAVARRPGTTDVFVTQPDGYVWHGFWPRKPR